MTPVQALESDIQEMLDSVQPIVAPELAGLFPKVTTRMSINGEDHWISAICRHPNNPPVNWWEPPKQYLVIHYRIGQRHQWLMLQNGKDWAMRRAETLIRLLLKRLACEVVKVNGQV